MKAVKYLRPGIALVDVEEPQLEKADDVKIKIEYASICASDVHMINGEWDWQFEGTRLVGHEAAGEIVELGPEATLKGLKIGDKDTFYFNEYCGKCFYCRNGQEHLCSRTLLVDDQVAQGVFLHLIGIWRSQLCDSLPDSSLIPRRAVGLRQDFDPLELIHSSSLSFSSCIPSIAKLISFTPGHSTCAMRCRNSLVRRSIFSPSSMLATLVGA